MSHAREAAQALLDAVKVEQRNESIKIQAAQVHATLEVASAIHSLANAYAERTVIEAADRHGIR